MSQAYHSVYIFPTAVTDFGPGVKVISGVEFHPCRPFFLRCHIPIESIQTVCTVGVLETTAFLRETLKRIDDITAVEGVVKIDYFSQGDPYVGGGPFRSFSFFMNEWSICSEGRFKLEKKITITDGVRLEFRKKASKFAPGDTMLAWSFGIVSDGRNNQRIRKIINQIEAFEIPEVDIMICGPSPYEAGCIPDYVKILPDTALYSDVRVPISKKKNRIISSARHENIVLMHDRISFASDWYKAICAHGNAFDIICPQILAEGNDSVRVQDWLEFNGEFGELGSAGRQMAYDEWSPRVYVDGGLLIAKTRLLRITSYSPLLHWGEGEDVDLARRLYQAGALFSLYTGLKVRTETYRHNGLTIKRDTKFSTYIKRLFVKIIRKLKRTRHIELEEKNKSFLTFCGTVMAGRNSS